MVIGVDVGPPSFCSRCKYVASVRLTSWEFHVRGASPSQQAAPHLLHVTRTPDSFTALCGGVDSRRWAACGSDEGPEGVRRVFVGPLNCECLGMKPGGVGVWGTLLSG